MPEHRTSIDTPRWVKVFGIIVLGLVLLVIISLLAGVHHGPGLHAPSSDAGGDIWRASITAYGEQQS